MSSGHLGERESWLGQGFLWESLPSRFLAETQLLALWTVGLGLGSRVLCHLPWPVTEDTRDMLISPDVVGPASPSIRREIDKSQVHKLRSGCHNDVIPRRLLSNVTQ